MPSIRKQINSRVTQSEFEGLQQLMDLLELNQAEAIRHCIRRECELMGIEIAEFMPKPGTHVRVQED